MSLKHRNLSRQSRRNAPARALPLWLGGWFLVLSVLCGTSAWTDALTRSFASTIQSQNRITDTEAALRSGSGVSQDRSCLLAERKAGANAKHKAKAGYAPEPFAFWSALSLPLPGLFVFGPERVQAGLAPVAVGKAFFARPPPALFLASPSV